MAGLKMAKRNIEERVEENTMMLKVIERDVETIKTNHLAHIEKDMSLLNAKVDKIDARIWWVLGLLVITSLTGMIGEYL